MSTNPKLVGISALYRGLSDADRGEALSLLSAQRYSPHLSALPDVFSIIPSAATQDQADNIVRGLMERVANSLTGDIDDDDISSKLEGDGDQKITVNLPVPLLSTVSLVRGPFQGSVPEDLVGILNLPGQFTIDGKYAQKLVNGPLTGDEDYELPLEGGLFSKLKKVASSVAKVASSVKSSPLGGLAMKALKVVPGVGSIISGVEVASSLLSKGPAQVKASVPAIKTAALGAAGHALTAAANKQMDDIGNMKAKDILSNPDLLIQALEKTFGPDAVTDAMFNILAAEGDFIDDVVSGQVASGPALTAYTPGVDEAIAGDWTDTAKSLLQSTLEGFQAVADKTKAAGSSAYSKLDPRMQEFLNENWGKLAGGAAGVAGTAALYYGTAKYMKEKDAQARLKVLQAKTAQAEKAAAAQRASLEAARKKRASAAASRKTSAVTPPAPGPVLPPIDDSTLPSFGTSPSGLSDGPSSGQVSASYIKVPFAGTVLSDLAGDGRDLFTKWQESLLKVNPAMLTGDLPRAAYDDFGAIFLVHGFPVDSVTVIDKNDLPHLESEIAGGHPLTSPYLTKRILVAALALLDPRANHSNLLIKTSSGFKPWTSTTFVLDPAALSIISQPQYSRHLSRRMRADLQQGVVSTGEANHCINAIRAMSQGGNK